MTVELFYFAILRDQRGLSSERLEIEPQTTKQLFDALKEEHGFTLTAERLRVSVNEQFVDWDTKLTDGDEVVFLPPVSGG